MSSTTTAVAPTNVPANSSNITNTLPGTYIYIKSYYILFGGLSALGNLYLILLFVFYSKLRTIQCNWLIIFLCTSDVLIGLGVFIKGLVLSINYDLDYDFYWCTIVTAPWICGYRAGQTIALLVAFDRFLAIARPTFYAKRQGNIKNVVLSSAVIILAVFCGLVFLFIYGADLSQPWTLDKCLGLPGKYYFQIVPSYSGIISIVFVVTYSASLIIFTRQVSQTKKQQIHAQKRMTTIQKKIFITVSLALLCYSIFYVVPTIMQMLYVYLGLPIAVFNTGSYIIFYGAEFNEFLNSVIYLLKHQEFKECNRRFIYRVMRKSLVSENQITRAFVTVRTVPSSNVASSIR